MGNTRKKPPTDKLAFQPNGRLTEHTAMVDVTNAPPLSYTSGGRKVSFNPTRLVFRFQWTWSVPGAGWVVLEIKALGVNGFQGVSAKITHLANDPETTPDWIKEAITLATPPLALVA
jgi:hypothetical protein